MPGRVTLKPFLAASPLRNQMSLNTNGPVGGRFPFRTHRHPDLQEALIQPIFLLCSTYD
jgi:hypothetical protein